MATVMKTPGVYVVEKNAFPNSVVEVATAVPAFIGHTQKSDNSGKSLQNVPWKIGSMAEFEKYFGSSPYSGAVENRATFTVKTTTDPTLKAFSLKGQDYQIAPSADLAKQYLLYSSMLLFFKNGGGPCYIVSVGNFDNPITAAALTRGITLLEKEQEPTMVVIPDAVRLDKAGCLNVQTEALKHCGSTMKSRFAILDIYDGFKDPKDKSGDCVSAFRTDIGINQLDYAAAYYPWLDTSIVSDTDLGYGNVNFADLKAILTAEGLSPEILGELDKLAPKPASDKPADASAGEVKDDKGTGAKPVTEEDLKARADLMNKTLAASSEAFKKVRAEIKKQLNLLPPSAAMAGVYTMVDNSEGVWKAPANVSLNGVVAPTVNISHTDQMDLNVHIQGKSINAIRTFVGEGVLVWGARTLDGNSLDWRYIGVRRTMIMLEQSIQLATKAYVFDNNVSTTWVTIKSMIRNFLTGIWKRGGLAGASPDDAFAVFCGLGETMTSEDILEGILKVTVLVAVTRPAEFIEITFQQQMQKS